LDFHDFARAIAFATGRITEVYSRPRVTEPALWDAQLSRQADTILYDAVFRSISRKYIPVAQVKFENPDRDVLDMLTFLPPLLDGHSTPCPKS
jgi:hypothetical protein